jgi:hypothetical protein
MLEERYCRVLEGINEDALLYALEVVKEWEAAGFWPRWRIESGRVEQAKDRDYLLWRTYRMVWAERWAVFCDALARTDWESVMGPGGHA